MNMEKEIIYRSVLTPPTANNRTIWGYAIVFNSQSEIMYDPKHGYFREIILPTAIDNNLLIRSDVKALYEHDRERLLARSKQGKGTLKLSIDSHGLRYEFEAPHTSLGNTVIELIKRGDLAGSSFAFVPEFKKIEKKGKISIVTITKIKALYDVSIVIDPAYPETETGLRNKGDKIDPLINKIRIENNL